jgi:predicted MFS family arabinose efflux permease
LALLLVRRSPEACGIEADGEPAPLNNELTTDYTLGQALSTPGFWVFGISSAIYGLIASGIALFNESILAERHFDASTYFRSLVIVALTSLVGNFLGGWIASRWKMNRLLSLAMVLLAGSLLALPHVSTQAHVAVYEAVMGIAGGFVIVIFFSFWSAAYGRKHLGKIQGTAQALTVIASALGPLALAETVSRTGSYASIFYLLAVVVTGLALLAWFVTTPIQSTSALSDHVCDDIRFGAVALEMWISCSTVVIQFVSLAETTIFNNDFNRRGAVST